MSFPRFWGSIPFILMFSSFAAPAELRRNIEYGRVGQSSLRLDASIPDGPGSHPAAIIVHGGGWVRGDRETSVAPLFQPLSNAGFAWFSISYRLANDFSIAQSNGIPNLLQLGAAVDDVREAVSYVKAHAAEFKVDPDRLVLIGESAGAQLASMAALKPGPNGNVAAVVAFYSPSDLVNLAETSPQIPESIRQAARNSPWAELLLAGLRAESPVEFVHKGMPPFLLIHGTADSLVPYSQSVDLCRKIQEAGATCDLYTVKGGGHGIRWWEAEHLTSYKAYMIRWLEEQLGNRS